MIFARLGLLLLAIEVKDEENLECNIAINPGPSVVIKPQTQGFFVAQSAEEVKRYVRTVCYTVIENQLKNYKEMLTKDFLLSQNSLFSATCHTVRFFFYN